MEVEALLHHLHHGLLDTVELADLHFLSSDPTKPAIATTGASRVVGSRTKVVVEDLDLGAVNVREGFKNPMQNLLDLLGTMAGSIAHAMDVELQIFLFSSPQRRTTAGRAPSFRQLVRQVSDNPADVGRKSITPDPFLHQLRARSVMEPARIPLRIVEETQVEEHVAIQHRFSVTGVEHKFSSPELVIGRGLVAEPVGMPPQPNNRGWIAEHQLRSGAIQVPYQYLPCLVVHGVLEHICPNSVKEYLPFPVRYSQSHWIQRVEEVGHSALCEGIKSLSSSRHLHRANAVTASSLLCICISFAWALDIPFDPSSRPVIPDLLRASRPRSPPSGAPLLITSS